MARVSSYIVFLLLLIFNGRIFSQDLRLDSLQKLYDNAKDGSDKLRLNCQIGADLFASDPKEGKRKIRSTLRSAQNSNNKELEAFATFYLGDFFLHANEFDSARYFYDLTLELNKKTGDKKIEASCFSEIGEIYRLSGDFKEAIALQKRSLAIKEKLDNVQDLSVSYHSLGNIYMASGDYLSSITYMMKGLKIDEDRKDKAAVSKAYNNIGNSYYYLQDFDKAFEYLEKGLKMREELNDIEGMINSYNNIASIYFSKLNFKKAGEYYFASYELNKKHKKSQPMMAATLNNIGLVCEYTGEIDKALSYYLEAQKVAEEIHSIETLIPTYLSLGVVYATKKKYRESDEYFEKSLSLAQKVHSKFNIKEF
jgi:tetratricopeptide (TPR) repeat protein